MRFVKEFFQIMWPVGVLLVIFGVLYICKLYREYKAYLDSAMYRATGISPRKILWNAKLRGTHLIYESLRGYEETGSKFLFDAVAPLPAGGVLAADMLMVSPQGVLVFSNFYHNGWVNGSDEDEHWGVIARKRHVRNHPNPVIFNHTYIDCLKSLLGEDVPFYSIVAISNQTYPTDSHTTYLDTRVTKYEDMKIIIGIMMNRQAKLSGTEMRDVYQKLIDCGNTSGYKCTRQKASTL